MRAHRALGIAAAILATATVLTGCSAAESDEETAAPNITGDGTVTVYSGRSEKLVGPLIEQFTAATGITVDVRYGSTGEMAALLAEEGAATPAQVFLSQDAGALGQLSSAGLLSTLPDSIAGTVPVGFTSADASWVGITGRARVVVYDSAQLSESEVPSTIYGVVDPQWNGQVAVSPGNAGFMSFVTALRVLDGESRADDWVADLAANAPQLTESNGNSLELVNAGSARLGLINHYYWYRMAAEVGEDNMRAKLKYLPGDPGGIVNVTGAAVLAGSDGDPDALAFIDYLLSDSGQSYFAETAYEYPLAFDVDSPDGLPSLTSLANPKLDLSELRSLEVTQQMLATHGLL